MRAVGRDEAQSGAVLQHRAQALALRDGRGSRGHGRHSPGQDEEADHTCQKRPRRRQREGPAPAPESIGPAGDEKGYRGAEREGADIAAHREAAASMGESLRHHAHARHVGAGQAEAHGAAQEHRGEKTVGPAGEAHARGCRPERAREVDAARRHVVRECREDHDRADIAELVEGDDQPRLAVTESPLLLEERQERGEVREDQERAELGGADGREPGAVIEYEPAAGAHRLACCSRHFLHASRRAANSFSSPRSTGL